MARSRRRTPIFGITTAASEKDDKARAHRAERAATRTAMAAEDDAPHPKRFGNRWLAAKDGKRWWLKGWSESMRK